MIQSVSGNGQGGPLGAPRLDSLGNESARCEGPASRPEEPQGTQEGRGRRPHDSPHSGRPIGRLAEHGMHLRIGFSPSL
jgi:hypothetical protein